MIAIKNAQIVLENGIIWDGVILVEGDKIAKFGKASEVEIPTDAEVIDADGAYVGPGFIDIHVHGYDNFCTCKNANETAEYYLKHGTTTMLSTADYLWDFDEFMASIRAAKEAMKTNKVIKGFYFEGPFINVKYGCNSDLNPWSPDNIPEEQYKAFVDEAGTYAKVWITAPERADIKGFAEYARKVNPEVVFAVGHSEATPMQIRAMGKYRPTLQTHSMCATGRVPVCGGTRGYGPDEYCFKESEVYTELICDSLGIHVHPEMQQLLIHNKGIDKVILVTDSTMDDCENPPELAHITDLNFDHNGGLAGSRLTMDQACKNIMTNTNCGIAQAFLMASTNPAKAIKMDEEIGSIDIGKKADLVFVDDKFNVKQVMSEGKMVC